MALAVKLLSRDKMVAGKKCRGSSALVCAEANALQSNHLEAEAGVDGDVVIWPPAQQVFSIT